MKAINLTLLAALFLNASIAAAAPKDSVRMVHSHNYNISNSIGAIANNYNIKETFFVDSKSICRHLGIIKASVDAVEITLKVDTELKKAASATMLESNLGQLKSLASQTTSYCGHNYASEEKFNAKLEANNEFMISQLSLLSNASERYFQEVNKVDSALKN